MLHRLEHRDRSTELQAFLRVSGGHLGALACQAHGLRRQHDAGEVDEQPPRAGQHGRRGAVEIHAGSAPRRVHVAGHLDGDGVACLRHVDDSDVVAGRDEDDVRDAATEHVAGVARRLPVLHGNGRGARQRHRADRRPVRQAGHVVLRGGAPAHGRHHAGDHRRHERPGSDGSTRAARSPRRSPRACSPNRRAPRARGARAIRGRRAQATTRAGPRQALRGANGRRRGRPGGRGRRRPCLPGRGGLRSKRSTWSRRYTPVTVATKIRTGLTRGPLAVHRGLPHPSWQASHVRRSGAAVPPRLVGVQVALRQQ